MPVTVMEPEPVVFTTALVVIYTPSFVPPVALEPVPVMLTAVFTDVILLPLPVMNTP